MVLKLAGKLFLFGILGLSSFETIKNPGDHINTSIFNLFPLEDRIKIVQLLSSLYFIVICLGFLEVRWAIWVIIINLSYIIFTCNNNLTIINNIVLISGLLLFYNKITRIKPLVINKKHNQ